MPARVVQMHRLATQLQVMLLRPMEPPLQLAAEALPVVAVAAAEVAADVAGVAGLPNLLFLRRLRLRWLQLWKSRQPLVTSGPPRLPAMQCTMP